jgi:hypothetical protein
MAAMGKYCKAYPLSRLRRYAAWTEKAENVRPDDPAPQDAPGEGQPAPVIRQLTDDDYLFVQENLIVTDGIFIDEHIIFDAITPEWEAFCTDELQFEIPDFEAKPVAETA